MLIEGTGERGKKLNKFVIIKNGDVILELMLSFDDLTNFRI